MANPGDLASLSLDLDNKWSYMKVHGDTGWESYPTYLDTVVPRILDIADRLNIKLTFFIVGQDAWRAENHDALGLVTARGHEVANHSHHHEPWLHRYSTDEINAELQLAEDAIVKATGQHPRGFRGPGFSLSQKVLQVLGARGYEYDASTFPTYLGPLARAYYFSTSKLSSEELEQRKMLFGTFSEGFRPLRPYRWQLPETEILEIPVTTIPLLKIPFHLSYVHYLAGYSVSLAKTYFRAGLTACRLSGIEPSLLLHPLDFMGGDDVPELRFFPAMQISGGAKAALTHELLETYAGTFQVLPMGAYAAHLRDRRRQPVLVQPRFPHHASSG